MKKGSKHSDETLKKMSESQKGHIPWNKDLPEEKQPFYGKHHSEETKKNMSGENHPMYGKQRPEHSERMKGDKNPMKRPEVRKKVSENHADVSGENHPMFGKKHTEEAKKKMSKAKTGENNHNWKGGIACEPYCDVWIDKEYKESIKERDNYTCQNPLCLCDSSKIVLHHINYIKKDCKPDNLITVCNSSNSRANKDRWLWQEIYERVVERNIKGEVN